MFSAVIATILKWLGGGVLDRVLSHLERRADSEIERRRIEVTRESTLEAERASVIRTGMQSKAFWIPWLIATIPLSLWFGWGMLDTLLNGDLPDVALIPPGLLPWAQTAWDNLFYAGGGVAAASIIGGAIARRK